MDFQSSLFLAVSIAAFCVFGVTVGYGQWVTRDLNNDGAPVAAKPKAVKSQVTAPAHSKDRVYEEAL